MKLGPRCLWVEGALPGCAGTIGSQRRALQSWDLDFWRVDPACFGDGPLGAQRKDTQKMGLIPLTNCHFQTVLVPLELWWFS